MSHKGCPTGKSQALGAGWGVNTAGVSVSDLLTGTKGLHALSVIRNGKWKKVYSIVFRTLHNLYKQFSNI